MLVLFKTSRSSIKKGWLSMCSQESMKTLLQSESLKEGCKHTDGHSMSTGSMEGGNRDDYIKLF